MALIQTLQSHCLNCLLFPPRRCFWEKDGLEQAVPFLYISVVCIFQMVQPSIPGSPSPIRAEGAWLSFQTSPRLLNSSGCGHLQVGSWQVMWPIRRVVCRLIHLLHGLWAEPIYGVGAYFLLLHWIEFPCLSFPVSSFIHMIMHDATFILIHLESFQKPEKEKMLSWESTQHHLVLWPIENGSVQTVR